MQIVSIERVSVIGSIATYKLTVQDSSFGLHTGNLTMDMDGNYAEWAGETPAELEPGAGAKWDELLGELDTNPLIVADTKAYYGEEGE